MKSTLFLWLTFLTANLFAGTDKNPSEPGIKITISNLPSTTVDSLELLFADHYLSAYKANLFKIRKAKKQGNAFYIQLPKNEKWCYIVLNKRDNPNPSKFIMKDFIAEVGDNIQLHYKDGTYSFRGNNFIKYELQFQLIAKEKDWLRFYRDSVKNERLKVASKYTTVEDYKSTENNPEKFNEGMGFNYSKLHHDLKLLESYTGRIRPFIFELIKTNLIGNAESEIVKSASFYSFKYKADDNDQVKQLVHNKILNSYNSRNTGYIKSVKDGMQMFSVGYTDYIISSATRSLFFGRDKYQWLKAKASGAFRDRLMTIFFDASVSNPNEINQNLDDALKIVKTGYCLEALTKLKMALERNALAFEFALPDSSGKIVKISDLKGKTVVMDFWFTGCVNCRVLTESMKAMVDTLSIRNDLKFVSINIDKNSMVWKESIKTHLYTHPGSIDLNTNGLGSDHPIIRHYNVKGYPRLIIIGKDGRLITGTAPKPLDGKSRKEFLELLN